MYEISNVTIKVKSLPETVKFYTDILGFSLEGKRHEQWAEVSAPGINVGIHPLQDNESLTEPTSRMSIGLHVKDIESAQATLAERGVKFDSTKEKDGPVLLSFFKDPDGHQLYLCQYV